LVIDDTQALGILGHSPGPHAPYGKGGGGSLQWAGIGGPDVLVVSSLAKGFGAPVAVLAGSEATVEMSLRGRHGYVDLTVTQSGSGDEMHGTVLVEVNGEDFASAECTGEEACTLARMNGDPLTPDEEEALQGLLGLYTYGFFITSELMAPVGAFFPLL
jgi:hypothetical protein